MPPTTSHDFLRAAGQRLTVAEVLAGQSYTLDAQYIGGYVVECSLKALVMHRTPEAQKPGTLGKITSGAAMHRPEVLLAMLREIGVVLPADLARRMRRFVSSWTTDLRYESGRRDTGETIAFLKTAKGIHDWVGGQIP